VLLPNYRQGDLGRGGTRMMWEFPSKCLLRGEQIPSEGNFRVGDYSPRNTSFITQNPVSG
jgi:hypothetical protein